MERKIRLESGFASMRPIVSLSLFYVLFLSMVPSPLECFWPF